MILQKRSTKAMSEMALRQGRFIFPQAGEVMLDWPAIFQSKQIEILANKKLFTRNMCHKSHLISSTCPHWRNFEKGFNSGLNEYSGIHFVPGCGNLLLTTNESQTSMTHWNSQHWLTTCHSQWSCHKKSRNLFHPRFFHLWTCVS